MDNKGSGKRRATRSSLACLPCRSRHLKCDGNQPQCTRCLRAGKNCDYAQSRRGGHDRAALTERRRKLGLPGNQAVIQASSPPIPSVELNTERADISDPSIPVTNWSVTGTAKSTTYPTPPDSASSNAQNLKNDLLIDSYYEKFHSFHPVVVPKEHMLRLYCDPTRQARLKPVLAVMRLIGHIYMHKEWSDVRREAIESCFRQIPTTDPFMIQSRMLYSIPLFWYGYKTEAKQQMDMACQLARQLGIFNESFAYDQGDLEPVMVESWRRTWWQLYVLDCYYAGTLGNKELIFEDIEPTTELPCEENEYESGQIPEPKTLDEFENREFSFEETSFSSFAYLVGAVKCAASAMMCASKNTKKEDSGRMIQVADSATDGWLLLLPKKSKQVLSKSGKIDELMFQAHMVIHVATVGVHRPFSDLKFNPVEEVSSCAREPPPDTPIPELVNVHTVRILRAVEAQTRLLALPVRPFHHSPFTTCVVSEGLLALLSACHFLLKGKELAVARSQIRMTIGCLKSVGEVWPRTARNVKEIQIIARHVLGLEQRGSANLAGNTPSSSDQIPSLSGGNDTGIPLEGESGLSSDDLFSALGGLSGCLNLGEVDNSLSWWFNE